MDPTTGRFTQQDTFFGFSIDPQSLNKYTYAHSNPIRFADPSGYSVNAIESGFTVSALGHLATSSAAVVIRHVVGVGTVMGARGLLDYVDYVNGFPIASMQTQTQVDQEAQRITAAAAVASVGLGVKQERHGHHTVPIYMCGAAEQNRVWLKASIHGALHSSLVTYSFAINRIYRTWFKKTVSYFSYSNKEPLQLLAETPQGRLVITKHLRNFYSLGWFALGAPYFEPIFESESIEYIGGKTSLPGCVRPDQ